MAIVSCGELITFDMTYLSHSLHQVRTITAGLDIFRTIASSMIIQNYLSVMTMSISRWLPEHDSQQWLYKHVRITSRKISGVHCVFDQMTPTSPYAIAQQYFDREKN